MLGAQIHQPGKAAYAGHGEVEQDEIDLRALGKDARHAFQIACLEDFSAGHGTRDRLRQRAAHERMIVGDQNPGGCGRHAFSLATPLL